MHDCLHLTKTSTDNSNYIVFMKKIKPIALIEGTDADPLVDKINVLVQVVNNQQKALNKLNSKAIKKRKNSINLNNYKILGEDL